MYSPASTAAPREPIGLKRAVRLATVALIAAAVALMTVAVLKSLIEAAPADVVNGLTLPAAMGARTT
jgi:hypothetical protein